MKKLTPATVDQLHWPDCPHVGKESRVNIYRLGVSINYWLSLMKPANSAVRMQSMLTAKHGNWQIMNKLCDKVQNTDLKLKHSHRNTVSVFLY